MKAFFEVSPVGTPCVRIEGGPSDTPEDCARAASRAIDAYWAEKEGHKTTYRIPNSDGSGTAVA